MLFPIAGLTYLGYYLDERLNSGNSLLTALGGILGVAAALYLALRSLLSDK